MKTLENPPEEKVAEVSGTPVVAPTEVKLDWKQGCQALVNSWKKKKLELTRDSQRGKRL